MIKVLFVCHGRKRLGWWKTLFLRWFWLYNLLIYTNVTPFMNIEAYSLNLIY